MTVKNRGWRQAAVVVACALSLGALAACGSDEASGTNDDDAALKIVFLAETSSMRYVASDSPEFEVAILEACPECQVQTLFSASQEEQNQQAKDVLAEGADVIVVAPVNSGEAAEIATAASAKDVPVICYDSLITGAPVDAYVTFDSGKVGEMGAQAVLSAKHADDAVVVVLAGDEASNNAVWVDDGASSVLEGKIDVGYHAWVDGWSKDNAVVEMKKAIEELDGTPIAGVVAANDGIAAGAAQALHEAGWKSPLPPISGQDAEVTALRRLLSGDQAVTAYKSMSLLAQNASVVALELGRGKDISAATTTTDNGSGNVPTVLLDPVAVTSSDIANTVIADGHTTIDALCAGAASALCANAGLR